MLHVGEMERVPEVHKHN